MKLQLSLKNIYIDIYFIIFISLTSLCSLLKVDPVLTLILSPFGFAHEFSACVVRRSWQMPSMWSQVIAYCPLPCKSSGCC